MVPAISAIGTMPKRMRLLGGAFFAANKFLPEARAGFALAEFVAGGGELELLGGKLELPAAVVDAGSDAGIGLRGNG